MTTYRRPVNRSDVEFLNENYPDYIKYYPFTRRVVLADHKHYTMLGLLKRFKQSQTVQIVKEPIKTVEELSETVEEPFQIIQIDLESINNNKKRGKK